MSTSCVKPCPGRPSRIARLVCGAAASLLAFASAAAAQQIIWLNQNPNDGGLFTTKNPTPAVVVGHQTGLYVWITKSGVTKGYDGVSLDVQVQSTDGGRVTTQIAIDNPDNRWTATYAGTPLAGTGGTGIENANAIDMTDTDTVAADPFRFARLTFTGQAVGTVKVFVGIGSKGIADDGGMLMFRIGMAANSTNPESQILFSSDCGSISSVPEATITVIDHVFGDFDSDGDVDLDDFADFQSCLNGPNRVPARPTGCTDADANGDGDVDLDDFQQFQGCFNGPNRPAVCGG